MTVSKTTEVGKVFISLCQTITESVEDKVHEPKKLTRSAEIAELNGFIESINAALEKAKPHQKLNPAKRELKKAVKTLSSLCDGLDDKELSVGEYRSLLDSTLQDSVSLASFHTNEVLSKLESDLEKENPLGHLNNVSSKSGDMSPQDVLALYREEYKKTFEDKQAAESGVSGDGYALDAHRGALQDAEYKKKIASYNRLRRNLPRTVKLFDVVQVPIVPLFEESRGAAKVTRRMREDFDPLPAERLLRTGIPFNKVGHITVFERQIVLAFNRKEVTKGRNTPKSKQAQTRLSKEYDSLVLELIEMINDRSAVKYTIASSKYRVSPSNKNVMFAWLLPIQQQSRLQQVLPKKLESWGFPWTV